MVSEAAITAFRASLRGVSFAPGEPGHDAARIVFNRSIDRRPALIARCAGAADVIACVCFARGHDLPISVRGGGHSIAGKDSPVARRHQRRHGFLRRWHATVAGAMLACLPTVAACWAQSQSQCATHFGVCTVAPKPPGSPCDCFGPGGRPEPGQIIGPLGDAPQARYGNACRTFRGVCQTSPAPVGSPCACFGDRGEVQ